MARPREFDDERVLEAVMDTFWRQGYERTSAQDLVDATGLGRGSLYAAYRDKDGLFEQAMLRYNRQSLENVERLRRPGKVRDRLRELLVSVAETNRSGADRRGCLATNTAIERAAADPEVAKLVQRNFDIMIGGIREAIERGQRTGEIAADQVAEDLALYIFATMQGLRVLARAPSSGKPQRLMKVIEQSMRAIT